MEETIRPLVLIPKEKAPTSNDESFNDKSKNTNKKSFVVTFTHFLADKYHVEFKYHGLYYDAIVPAKLVDTDEKSRSMIWEIIHQSMKGKSNG